MSMSPVSMWLRGDVAMVSIDDGKVNAFNSHIVNSLLGVLHEAEARARAVVISGRPEVFSAGLDLNVVRAGGKSASDLFHEATNLGLRLVEFPRPVVAAVGGHALGSGAAMLLCCDVRIGAVGNFQIGLNDVSIGHPLSELVVELARWRLSPRHMTMACNTARIYSPSEAVDAGFLDRVTTDGVAEDAFAVASGLASRLDATAFAQTRKNTCRRLTETIMRTSAALLRTQRG